MNRFYEMRNYIFYIKNKHLVKIITLLGYYNKENLKNTSKDV